MIKIMIVDDDIIVRKGISGILENISGVSVVAEAESGEEALTLARGQALDIVFVDIQMPGIGGYETMQRLLHHYPKLKIVVLSVFSSGLYPRRFLSSGASGYLTKGASSDELEKAIKKIHAGGIYITQQVAQDIIMSDFDEDSPNKLNKRELQVLHLIASGCSNDEMADNLKVSKKTISRHRQMLFTKLDVTNDVQLARIAISNGVCELASTAVDKTI
ncbi:MAG: response regulator transcription factor [Piscirickettsiaceae bacterium]|nr:response regulator transcription factor [Piscirickettsiaceae bacterium]